MDIKHIAAQYKEVLLRNPHKKLTEEMLHEIAKSIARNRNASIDELYNLSKSLAYSR
ncbi:hypothetical protein D3C75_1330700 [compost metagenome]